MDEIHRCLLRLPLNKLSELSEPSLTSNVTPSNVTFSKVTPWNVTSNRSYSHSATLSRQRLSVVDTREARMSSWTSFV